MLSALSTWSLTRPGVAGAAGAVHALQALGFLGEARDSSSPRLFLAGVSTAAIPRSAPRWVMWLGIVTAVACELASFTLVNFTAGYFIPVGRFISILWMIAASLSLPIGKPAPRPTPS